MGQTILTADELATIFETATAVFKASPRVGPSIKVTYWPSVLHDWHAYGYTDAVAPRDRPTSEMISIADKACRFVRYIKQDNRKLIWLRSAGMRWTDIARELGLHRNTAQRRYTEALLTAVRAINLSDQAQ